MTLTVTDLGFRFPGREPVLDGVGFKLDQAEILSLLGPNGTGKTTLMRCILGLLRSTSGQIAVNGRDVTSLSARELARSIAYVPQASHPGTPFSVMELVLMGRTAHLPALTTPKADDRAIARRELEELGIAHLAARSVAEISGGERQLALIARALAQQAPVLLMDEPTASLDYGNQVRLLRCIRAVAARGFSVLLSTHAPDHAFLLGGRVAMLKDGAIAAIGSPQTVVTCERLSWLYGTPIDVVTHQPPQGDPIRLCVPQMSELPPVGQAA